MSYLEHGNKVKKQSDYHCTVCLLPPSANFYIHVVCLQGKLLTYFQKHFPEEMHTKIGEQRFLRNVYGSSENVCIPKTK